MILFLVAHRRNLFSVCVLGICTLLFSLATYAMSIPASDCSDSQEIDWERGLPRSQLTTASYFGGAVPVLFGLFDSGYDKKKVFNGALVGIGLLVYYAAPVMVGGNCYLSNFSEHGPPDLTAQSTIRMRQWIFSGLSLAIASAIALTADAGPTQTASLLGSAVTASFVLYELIFPREGGVQAWGYRPALLVAHIRSSDWAPGFVFESQF